MRKSYAVLVLNADYRPHATVSWKQALIYVVRGIAHVLDTYEDWKVRSPSRVFDVPCVIVLHKYVGYRQDIKFTRSNIYARDQYQCQYCGLKAGEGHKLSIKELTFDHVYPISRGGDTSWTNIATCCQRCNCKKADKTPEEANMPLLKIPRKPSLGTDMGFILGGRRIPDAWKIYISQ